MSAENHPSLEGLVAQSARIHRLALDIAHDRDVAEDLAQDTWVSLLRGSGPAPRNLPGWLAGTMGNLFRTRIRGERRRADHERANAREELEAGSEAALERFELHEALVRAVRELKEPYRTTVLLRWFEDLEPLEIARRSGVPVRTVHTRVTRALEMLRAKLQRAGYGEAWSMWIALSPVVCLRIAGKAALAVKTKTKVVLAAVAIGAVTVTVAVMVPRITSSRSSDSAAPRLVQPQSQQRVHERPAVEVAHESRQAVASDPALAPTPASTPSKAAITGRVRVKGFAPTESLTLRLLAEGEDPNGTTGTRATVAGDGAFTFAGLVPGFEGRIQLPRRYALAGSHPRQRSIPVAAPSEDQLLDLERLPALTGRLVARSSGEEIEDAAVQALLTWDDGGQTLAGADSEAGGRFYVATSESKTLQAVRLEATAPGGLRGKFELVREQIPNDLDLGLLALDRGTPLHLVVLDPERQPLAGARAQPWGPGATFADTDAEGRATLAGLEPGTKVNVLARGFDPRLVEAPAVQATLEIQLERATRLIVRVLGPEGEPLAGIRVRVSGDAPPFVGTRGAPDAFLVPHIPSVGAQSAQAVQHPWFSTWFVTDAAGEVALQSVVPGLLLEIALQDELDTLALVESVAALRPKEVRELVLRLPQAPRSLSGVVVDPAGQPVERAQVGLVGEDHTSFFTTQADGRFRFEGLLASNATLRAQCRGYVSAYVPDVPLDASADLQVELEPGRDACVRVVDGSGADVELGTLTAALTDGERTFGSEGFEGGCHRLLDLPARELEVRLALAGKEFRARLGPHQDRLELRVPTFGRLEVTCSPETSIARERLGLRLKSTEDGELELMVVARASAPAIFEAVLPGDYVLDYVTWEPSSSDDVDPSFSALSAPMSVQIQAGQSTRVELR